MDVRLPPELEALVREKIASGHYRDEAEVVAAALQVLKARDEAKLAALLAAIDEGDADLEAGRFIDIDSEEEFDAFIAGL
jgi:putative addiction module CopG family antidote